MLHVPELPFSPADAINLLESQYFDNAATRPTAVMGSSLGGYYALGLAAKYNLNAAVLNPAVSPYELLRSFMGDNVNLYTGLNYQFTPAHIHELLAIRIDRNVYRRGQVMVLLQSGDQILDSREAATLLADQPQWIFPGGTHEFENFETVIPAVISHFRM